MLAIIVDEFPQVCRDCGEPMERIEQTKFNGGVIQLITCWKSECLLHGVTLTPEQYNGLSESQLESYRETNRKRAGEG